MGESNIDASSGDGARPGPPRQDSKTADASEDGLRTRPVPDLETRALLPRIFEKHAKKERIIIARFSITPSRKLAPWQLRGSASPTPICALRGMCPCVFLRRRMRTEQVLFESGAL